MNHREVDKLKLRVQELEAELSIYKSRSQLASIPTPDQTLDPPSPVLNRQNFSQESVSELESLSKSSTLVRPQWGGIYVATARSDHASYYGPSSSFYFVSRIGAYLGKTLKQQCPDRSMLPRGASRIIHLGHDMDVDDRESREVIPHSNNEQTRFMTRIQEESLLRLFWEGYYCLLPIIDEVEFRKYYASLWDPSRTRRKQSPLVDIILALCLQYGYIYIPRVATATSGNDTSYDDASVAGRWYYRRAQSLLTADMESPTLTTIQCYIFITSYLCCASFQNMCHIVTAQAVRAAHVLGLHLEPPASMIHGERELRKRVWWALWAMDTRVSHKMGRPFLIDRSTVTVSPPSDDLEAASYNGATLGSYGPDVTWLTYSLQSQKLILNLGEVHNALFNKCGEMACKSNATCLYADPQALEDCAKVLSAKLLAMKVWTNNVPMGMKTQRRNGGAPLSTDGSMLDIEELAPTWLQRQRVCLELMYHSWMINLTRPFITFYSHPGTYTPMTERHASTCIDHAVAYTLIMHQLMTESDLMGGWSEYFSFQWNAAITTVGFILANPIHPATIKARQALDKAIAAFDIFGKDFGVAADAAAIMRDLVAKADLLSGRLGSGITSPATVANDTIAESNVDSMDACGEGLSWLDPSQQNDPEHFNQFMEWALSVDAFNDFDKFFDADNSADPWSVGRQ